MYLSKLKRSVSSCAKTQRKKRARVLLEIPVDRDFIIVAAIRTFCLPIPPSDFTFDFPRDKKTDGRQR